MGRNKRESPLSLLLAGRLLLLLQRERGAFKSIFSHEREEEEAAEDEDSRRLSKEPRVMVIVRGGGRSDSDRFQAMSWRKETLLILLVEVERLSVITI